MSKRSKHIRNVRGFNIYIWSGGGDYQGKLVEGIHTTKEPTCWFAAHIPEEIDMERVQMLFGDDEGTAFLHYIESNWFPLARVPADGDAMSALADKTNSIPPERLEDYVLVCKSHWQAIEDNFKWPLPVVFDDAVAQEKRLLKERKDVQ